MKLFYYLLLSFYISTSLNGQIIDDFGDGNFTSNPVWSGDVANFIVNPDKQLQLNAPSGGVSILHTDFNLADSTIWEFYVKLAFSPSTTNSLRVYLSSTDTNLASGNGYFLEVGETGNQDAFRFYRSDAGISTLLFTCSIGTLGSDPAMTRMKIRRDSDGSWKISSDYTGNSNFTNEGTFIDNTYGKGAYNFGFICTYTETRKDKYFFDEVKVYEVVPDITPPELTSLTIPAANQLSLQFSENLDPANISVLTNYNVTVLGNPSSVIFNGNNGLTLNFGTNMTSQSNYTLTINELKDLAGNIIIPKNTPFTYTAGDDPQFQDLIFTEIFADPSPIVGLPGSEFLEIYNRSNKFISTKGIQLGDPTTTTILGERIIAPGEYLIICSNADTTIYKIFGKVLGFASGPSLNNSGDDIFMKDKNGGIIDEVQYSDSWYNNPVKKDGGYTLELINPLNLCLQKGNWVGSNSPIGGTPGQTNSVWNPLVDIIGPKVISIFPSQTDQVIVSFNEKLDTDISSYGNLLSLEPSIAILGVELGMDEQSLVFNLVAALELGKIYIANLKAGVKDCNNVFGEKAGPFSIALPAIPQKGDIVINELLFNPFTGGFDFIEFYNKTDKVFDISSLLIGNIAISPDYKGILTQKLLLPASYVAFSESINDINSKYAVKDSSSLVENDLPSYSDDKGVAALAYNGSLGLILLDSFGYNQNMHSSLLGDTEGISLERINPKLPTNQASNWQSAASLAGFATPGYQNSQFQIPGVANGRFSLSTGRVSPDGDGYEDNVFLNYQLPENGYFATIKIFDSVARPVFSLLNNESLGTSGSIGWDGTNDLGEICKLGIYIVHIDYYNTKGDLGNTKLTIVVAGIPR